MNALHAKGINDLKIIEAMNRVPRHLFINSAYSAIESYDDIALPIDCDQTISQPYTVAFQTQLLNILPREKVLEIGTGSGYQAAVLFELGVQVYTVERHQKLFISTSDLLVKLGYAGIKVFYGDGNVGLEQYAPFDKIIITAEAKDIPINLLNQLRPEGLMVLPLNGKMLRIRKDRNNNLFCEDFGSFKFVPLLQGVIN